MKRFKKLFLHVLIFVFSITNLGILGLAPVFAESLRAPSEFKAEVYQDYIHITWKNNNTSHYYTVIEKSVDQGTFYPIRTLSKGTTSYKDQSVSNGHVYTYRARAFYSKNTSDYTGVVEVITLYPDDFDIVRTSHNQVDLEWTYPALLLNRSPDYKTYIERRTSESSKWSVIATLPVTETFYRDTTVKDDTVYYYRIRTRYTNGNYSSYVPSSSGISTRTDYPLTTPLWGYAISESKIRLEWDMSQINDGEAILQRQDSTGEFDTIYTSETSNTTIDTGLDKGKTYTYRLMFRSEKGIESEFTDEISIITELVPTPTDLEVTALSSERMALSWAFPFEVETGFEIWRKSDGIWENIVSLPKNTDSFIDTSVASGETYTYQIRAKRGETAFSSFTQAVTVMNDYPSKPEPLAFLTNGGMLSLYSYDEVPDNTSYTLEVREGINSEWIDFKTCEEGTLIAHVGYSDSSEFHFRLRANRGGLASYGPEYHFYGTAPDPARDLHAPLVGYDRVLLTWKDSGIREEGYQIYRTINGVREQIGSVDRDIESFCDIAPVAGSISQYEVVAYNISGESAATAITLNIPKIVTFNDISSYGWAHNAIYKLQGLGAYISDPSGFFYPERTLSRGEAVRMILKSFNIPYQPPGLFTFNDIYQHHPYYKDLMTAASLGLAFPDSEGRIYPDKPITRRDLVNLLTNALNYTGKPLNPVDTEILKEYSDYYQISDNEKHIIASFVGDGIISGKSGKRIGLSDNATRAEAVTIIYRILMRYSI